MPSTMASLVTDPNSFFRDRRDDASFLGPALIITGIAVLGVVSSVVLSAVLGFVFTLWGALLWTLAVKHARQVETKHAVIAVALPVLLGLGASMWGLLGAVNVL